jgi:hypothetical protein
MALVSLVRLVRGVNGLLEVSLAEIGPGDMLVGLVVVSYDRSACMCSPCSSYRMPIFSKVSILRLIVKMLVRIEFWKYEMACSIWLVLA